MHPHTLARRHAMLQSQISSLMSSTHKWRTLPSMLDELHQLRTQYIAARLAFDSLTEDTERLAFRAALS